MGQEGNPKGSLTWPDFYRLGRGAGGNGRHGSETARQQVSVWFGNPHSGRTLRGATTKRKATRTNETTPLLCDRSTRLPPRVRNRMQVSGPASNDSRGRRRLDRTLGILDMDRMFLGRALHLRDLPRQRTHGAALDLGLLGRDHKPGIEAERDQLHRRQRDRNCLLYRRDSPGRRQQRTLKPNHRHGTSYAARAGTRATHGRRRHRSSSADRDAQRL
jgi:hypothetical protein